MTRAIRMSTLAATIAFAVGPPSAGAAQGCGAEVRSAGELAAAVNGSANEGEVVCARSGDYGRVRLGGRHAGKVTVRPYPGELPSLGSIELDRASGLRIEGFTFRSGGITTANAGGSERIEIAGNRFEDYTGSALMLWGGDTDIVFERNVVRNMRFDGGFETGWGISAIGGEQGIRGLTVRYNSFAHTEQDAMEIGGTYGGAIVGNLVRDVKPPPGTDAHTDSLMLWADSRDFLIKDNRFEDGHGVLMSGSTSDVRVENNLIVRMANLCHDAGPTGSSDAGVVNYTWIRNTIYDCGSYWDGGGFGGGYGFGSLGPATAGASNHAERNLFTSFDVDTAAQFSYEDYNVIANGRGRGEHDVRLTPRFRDRVDYQATNLPFAAGYRPAPAGARPCGSATGRRRAACRLRIEVARKCTGTARLRACRTRVRRLAACRELGSRRKRAACRRRARDAGRPGQAAYAAALVTAGAHPGWARPVM